MNVDHDQNRLHCGHFLVSEHVPPHIMAVGEYETALDTFGRGLIDEFLKEGYVLVGRMRSFEKRAYQTGHARHLGQEGEGEKASRVYIEDK